jgi:energy-coupling factor transporter ATP-binding protein EcfA2
MNDLQYQELVEILEKPTRVLLLGQHYLGASPDSNPLLAEFAVEYPGESLYDWWLKSQDEIGQRAKSLCLLEEKVPVGEGVKRLLALPWMAVFTSAFDSLIRRHLEVAGRRQVRQFLTPGFNRAGTAPSLPLFRLFGSIERQTREELPPATNMELFRRIPTTTKMLDPLLEIVTPSGYLFIEGWKPERDWLNLRDLFTSLVPFAKGQVLLFGVTPSDRDVLETDRDFARLLDFGIVRTFLEPLIEYLKQLEALNLLQIESLLEVSDKVFYPVIGTRKIPKDETLLPPQEVEQVVFSRLEWRKLTQGEEAPLELDQTAPLPETAEEKYEVFRSFIANGPQTHNRQWLRHIVFRRPVFDRILVRCLNLSEEPVPQDHVVMLYGQAGSGKTTLLNLLALELRRRGLPVVLVERSIPPVNVGNLDAFCQKVSEVSPQPVFLLHDGLQEPQDYLNLASYMAGRGRKIIVVGTAYPGQRYKISKTKKKKAETGGFHANIHELFLDVNLLEKERDDFLTHINLFLPNAKKNLSLLLRHYELANFFALIYRLLPPIRQRIEWSLINEFLLESKRIQKEIERSRTKGDALHGGKTLLEIRLREALTKKLGDKVFELFHDRMKATTSEGESYEINDAQILINAVMLASRVLLCLPQSMALRLIQHSIPVYRGALAADIIQEIPNPDGTFALRARLPLEARIWLQSQLPLQDDQFELIRRLVLTIGQGEVVTDESPELDFIVKLLQSIGPKGPEDQRMTGRFFDIANLVGDMQARYKEIHPRLLLLFANTVREWVRLQQPFFQHEDDLQNKKNMIHQWLTYLEKAERALIDAYDIVRKNAPERRSPAARRLFSTLETERAAVLGTKIGTIQRYWSVAASMSGNMLQEVDRFMKEARDAWRQALIFEENSYQALDIACWVYADRFAIKKPELQYEADYLADWLEIMELYKEIDIAPSQYDQRDKREMELSHYIGDLKRFSAVAAQVMARGSFAAYILTARLIENEESKLAAKNYLEQNCAEALFTDRNVLVYYMRLWWQTETGYDSFFPKERLCLPFSHSQWETLEKITTSRLSLSGEQDHGPTLFLRACALIHLRRVEEARRTLDYLDRLGVGGFRRSRALLLMSDDHGEPRQLIAEYQGRRHGARFLAWCDELRCNVEFLPIEHGVPDPRLGQQIGPFHLSIGYRGLFAEPTFRFVQSRKKEKSDAK